MQVKYVVAYTVDIDWGGEIETVSEITAAPGYGKFHGQLNPKRWIFRLFGGQRGFIKVPGTKNFLGYNAKRKRYWVTPNGEDPLFADMNWGDESDEETEEKEDTEEVSVTIKTEEKDKDVTQKYVDLHIDMGIEAMTKIGDEGEKIKHFKY